MRSGGCWRCGCSSAASSETAGSARPVCILFEGWDASGKGGAIKRLVAPLDPRHVRVATFGAPTEDERRHHFLWRFGPVIPGSATCRCSTAPGTGVCSSSGSRACHGRPVVARVRRDRRVRAHARARGRDRDQVLDAHLRRRAAEAFRAARKGPAQALEADRRGLAQPRAPSRLRAWPSRTCSRAPTTSSGTGSSSRPSPSPTRA